MVRVIMGVKGTGKTKQMIELINSAVHSENGNVVCIERGPKLTYDIHYKILWWRPAITILRAMTS